MYKEIVEEDDDKYDNINDYYLRRIKFPLMYKNINEIEKGEEEGEEEEDEQNADEEYEYKEKEDGKNI